MNKTCKICGLEKPMTSYYKCPTAKDGHYNRCKRCMLDAGRLEVVNKRLKDKSGIVDIESEIWISVAGYEEYYQVSNLGRVKSLKRTVNVNREGFTDKYYPEKLMSLSYARGYPVVSLTKAGKSKTFLLHRLIAIAFIPNPDNKPHINHKDNNRGNYAIDNLEWCTTQENTEHARLLGVIKGNGGAMLGKISKNRKLSDDAVWEILAYKKTSGQTMKKYFKEKYNISLATISKIRSGKGYREIYDLFESGIAIRKTR